MSDVPSDYSLCRVHDVSTKLQLKLFAPFFPCIPVQVLFAMTYVDKGYGIDNHGVTQ
jgi:hypothetical protein